MKKRSFFKQRKPSVRIVKVHPKHREAKRRESTDLEISSLKKPQAQGRDVRGRFLAKGKNPDPEVAVSRNLKNSKSARNPSLAQTPEVEEAGEVSLQSQEKDEGLLRSQQSPVRR